MSCDLVYESQGRGASQRGFQWSLFTTGNLGESAVALEGLESHNSIYCTACVTDFHHFF